MRLPFRAGRGRVGSARELALANRIHEQTEGNARAGKPLAIHASPFYLDVGDYLRAAAGPPAWSTRLARIQQLSEELRQRLDSAWEEHRRQFEGCPGLFADAWRHYLAHVDLSRLNELIDKHNAYYPIEAGLKMQWPSGRYILPAGMRHPQPRISIESLLEAYPADIAAALSGNAFMESEQR